MVAKKYAASDVIHRRLNVEPIRVLEGNGWFEAISCAATLR